MYSVHLHLFYSFGFFVGPLSFMLKSYWVVVLVVGGWPTSPQGIVVFECYIPPVFLLEYDSRIIEMPLNMDVRLKILPFI